MAVRADRPQLLDRIDLVLAADLGQRPQVVDVDVSFSHLTVPRSEVEAANAAAGAVGFDAPPPGFRVSLVGVDRDAGNSALVQVRRLCALLRQPTLDARLQAGT